MRLLNFFLIFFIHFGLISQNLPSINYTVNNGLPSNSIKAIFKDSRGFLWIGTEGGLACFNGNSFKIFNETNGLRCNQVWAITEDDKHNIWISLYGKGLAKYDGNKFTYFDKEDGLVNNAIRRIHFSKKHKCLILGTENGLSIFDGKRFKNFQLPTQINKFQIVGINESSNEILIHVTSNKVYKLIIIKEITKSTLTEKFTPTYSYSGFLFNNQYYSGGTDHILYVKNLINLTEQKFLCPIIWDFTKDNSNTIYGAGWNVIDPNGGLFEVKNNQLINLTRKANIKSTGLWCLYFDKQTNQLWCGSIDHGLYKVDLSNFVKLYPKSFFNLNEFSPQEMMEDKLENIWIGAKDKIVILNKRNQFRVLTKENLYSLVYKWRKSNRGKIEELIPKAKLENGFSCFNIVQDKENNIWVNTTWGTFCFNWKFEMFYFNPSDGGHLIFNHKDVAFYGHMYADLWEIKDKMSWGQNTINHSINNNNIPADINKMVLNGNQVWFASQYKGLFVRDENHFISFNSQGSFKESTVTDLAINDKNEVIVGTSSGNVYVVSYSQNHLIIIQKYTSKKEIIGTSISFVEYLNGIYYIGTNEGLNLIKNNKRIKFINQSEGLSDVNFIDCIKTKSKNLFISTNKGIFKIDIRNILKKPKSYTSQVYIQSIKINNKTIKEKFTQKIFNKIKIKGNQLQLKYPQNNIEIRFISNNLFNALKNVYRYKIEGLSNNWSGFERNGKIALLGLPHGNYKLILQGKNLGTGEIFKSYHLNLIINPPFWKTWWFISLTIVLIITLLISIIRYRIRLIEKREIEKSEISNKLTETKLEALRAQMNPHFTFNAINSIQNFIIDNDAKNAMFYLGEFSKLIRQTLENASEKFMPLETEIQFLESYMNVQKMRFDKIKTSIKLDQAIDKYRTQIPPLIIQPFIENAFEHAFNVESDDPVIHIHFYIENHFLVCKITDNGNGFKEGDSKTMHKSFGKKLTLERLDLLNREFNTKSFGFTIQNRNELVETLTGTEVVITFNLILE